MEILSGLGCHGHWRHVAVDLMGSLSVQAGVGSGLVVEVDVLCQGGSRFVDRVVGSEVDLFIFDRSPDSFHEDIVAPAAFSVHKTDGEMPRNYSGKLH